MMPIKFNEGCKQIENIEVFMQNKIANAKSKRLKKVYKILLDDLITLEKFDFEFEYYVDKNVLILANKNELVLTFALALLKCDNKLNTIYYDKFKDADCIKIILIQLKRKLKMTQILCKEGCKELEDIEVFMQNKIANAETKKFKKLYEGMLDNFRILEKANFKFKCNVEENVFILTNDDEKTITYAFALLRFSNLFYRINYCKFKGVYGVRVVLN